MDEVSSLVTSSLSTSFVTHSIHWTEKHTPLALLKHRRIQTLVRACIASVNSKWPALVGLSGKKLVSACDIVTSDRVVCKSLATAHLSSVAGAFPLEGAYPTYLVHPAWLGQTRTSWPSFPHRKQRCRGEQRSVTVVVVVVVVGDDDDEPAFLVFVVMVDDWGKLHSHNVKELYSDC